MGDGLFNEMKWYWMVLYKEAHRYGEKWVDRERGSIKLSTARKGNWVTAVCGLRDRLIDREEEEEETKIEID